MNEFLLNYYMGYRITIYIRNMYRQTLHIDWIDGNINGCLYVRVGLYGCAYVCITCVCFYVYVRKIVRVSGYE